MKRFYVIVGLLAGMSLPARAEDIHAWNADDLAAGLGRAESGDHGGGVYSEATLFSAENNQVEGCRARFGGGMAIRVKPALGGDPPLVHRNTFTANRAEKDGGALFLADLPEVKVENNVIFMNTAGVGDGLAIAADAKATVAHNTFVHIQYISGRVDSLPIATAVQIAGANNATKVVNNIIFGHLCGVIGDANVRALVAGNDF